MKSEEEKPALTRQECERYAQRVETYRAKLEESDTAVLTKEELDDAEAIFRELAARMPRQAFLDSSLVKEAQHAMVIGQLRREAEVDRRLEREHRELHERVRRGREDGSLTDEEATTIYDRLDDIRFYLDMWHHYGCRKGHHGPIFPEEEGS